MAKDTRKRPSTPAASRAGESEREVEAEAAPEAKVEAEGEVQAEAQAEAPAPKPVGFGAPPTGGPPSLAAIMKPGEPTVKMVFAKELRMLIDGKQIIIPPGAHDVPERLKGHWWFKANDVRLA